MICNYLYKYLWILLFCNFSITVLLSQNCTSTTAIIRYAGNANYSLLGNIHTQDWLLRNQVTCDVIGFRIEEFPEVFRLSNGAWVPDNTSVTITSNPTFDIIGYWNTETASVSFTFVPPTNDLYRIYFRIKDQYNTTLSDPPQTSYPGYGRLYAEVTSNGNLPQANLQISNASVPSSVTAGSIIFATCNVDNVGTGNAIGSVIKYWLSNVPNINNNPDYLGFLSVSSINSGQSSNTIGNVNIPQNATSGFVCFEADADNVISESNESDNVSCVPITITPQTSHDLTTSGENVSPNTIQQGGTFTANYIANYAGNGSTVSNVRIYLSTDNIFDGSDTRVGINNQITLSQSNSSQSFSTSCPVSLSVTPDTYNVLFISDHGNNVSEGTVGESNNVRIGGQVTITAISDFTVINQSINKTFVMPNDQLQIMCTHNYAGTGQALYFIEVGFYLSTTPNITSSSILFDSVTAVIGGTNPQVNIVLSPYSIPIVPNGTYYIVFKADNDEQISETNEQNNITSSVPFIISNTPPAADVTVSNIQIANGVTSFYGSGSVSISANQNYIGPGSVKPDLEFLLSKTPYLTSNAIPIGELESASLSNSNPSATTSVWCSLSPNISPGSYYLVAYADADNDVTETYENNNTQVYTQQIRVLPSYFLDYGPDYVAANHLCTKIGDPINAATGEFLQQQIDMELYSFGQSFPWQRSYRSNSGYDGDLGHGWTHSYDIHLTVSPERWTVHYSDGHKEPFVEYHDGSTYPMYWHMKDTIGRNPDSSYTLIKPNGVIYTFYKSGKVASIKNEANIGLTFTYNGIELSRVNLSGGRYYDLTYQNGKIVSVTDNASRSVSYQYDANGNLITYTNTRGGTFQYVYDTQNRIISITDPKGITFVQNVYDTNGRVIEQRDGNNNLSTLQYQPSGSSYSRTIYTNPLGEVEEYSFRNQTQRLYSYRDPNGNWKSFGYGGGHLIDQNSVTDQEGNQSSLARQYHPTEDRYKVAKPIRIYNALNQRSDIVYGLKNLPIAFVNSNGDTTSIIYDSLRNPLTVQLPNGAQLSSGIKFSVVHLNS